MIILTKRCFLNYVNIKGGRAVTGCFVVSKIQSSSCHNMFLLPGINLAQSVITLKCYS